MAATIRKVDYYSMKVPNRPGVGAKLLDMLKDADVYLHAFTGFPEGGNAQVDFVPKDRSKFLRAAKKAGMKVSQRKTAFLVQGEDRTGALAGILDKLAAARIGLTALDAVAAGKGRYGAIFWVKKPNVARAARVLKAR